MKEYHLNKEQWGNLWLEKYTSWMITNDTSHYSLQVDINNEYQKRVQIFIEKFPNLYYRELDTQQENGYYGIITYHNHKDLTFLLLQL